MAIQYGIEFEMQNITGNEVWNAVESAEPASGHIDRRVYGWHSSAAPSPGRDNGGRDGRWFAMRDGSLSGPGCTENGKGNVELVSSILYGEAGDREMLRVLTRLNAAGATVDQSCGTHITVGLNNNARWNRLSVAGKVKVGNRIVEFYNHFQAVFDAMSPNCRQVNGFSAFTMRAPELMTESRNQGTRYSAVNLSNYILYGASAGGRIEFRQPGYTLSAKKIMLWLKIIRCIISMALNENHRSRNYELTEMPQTVTGMATYLGLGAALEARLRARIEELYRNHRSNRASRALVLSSDVFCISCEDQIHNPLSGQNLCAECE